MSVRGEIKVKTRTGGGLLNGLIRRTLAGESLFLNTFVAKSDAEVKLAPSLPGDIKYLQLTGEGYIIQDFSYLVHHEDVKLSVTWRV